jgi:hypothetical protein
MNNPKSAIKLFFIALLIVALACANSTTNKLEEVSNLPVMENANSETQQNLNEEEIKEPTQEEPAQEEPTQEAPAEEINVELLAVIKSGFGQDGQEIGYSFIVENPNLNFAIENSEYQIAAYDSNNTVVETDSGYIEIVLPEQALGIAGSLYADEGVKVSKIEVQLKQGDPEQTDSLPLFIVDATTYFPDEYFSSVTGRITNPFDRDLKDLRVSAILFDEAGEIIGGGYTYLNFILANSSTGVDVSVVSDGEVNSIEIYPVLSGLTFFGFDPEIPSDASSIELLKYGVGQEEFSTGYGFLVSNTNSNYSIETSQYHVTSYSIDGNVIDTDEGYINVLLPNQTIGWGGDLYSGDATVSHIEVQILPGKYNEANEIPIFSTENVSYQSGSYSSKATGIILSPYNTDITDLRVSALAYNENGEIVGGGYTYLDFIPANGQAAVEVNIATGEMPTDVEIFATVSSLSEFE